jgi:hypothetical protein
MMYPAIPRLFLWTFACGGFLDEPRPRKVLWGKVKGWMSSSVLHR